MPECIFCDEPCEEGYEECPGCLKKPFPGDVLRSKDIRKGRWLEVGIQHDKQTHDGPRRRKQRLPPLADRTELLASVAPEHTITTNAP